VAQATLTGPSGRPVTQGFYVDSGADHTLISYKIGRLLGCTADSGGIHEIHGVNGVVGVIYVTLSVAMAGRSFKAPVAWAQMEEVPLLLGRAGVFDQFEIRFRQNRREVRFDPL
jgi:hypothetical protein